MVATWESYRAHMRAAADALANLPTDPAQITPQEAAAKLRAALAEMRLGSQVIQSLREAHRLQTEADPSLPVAAETAHQAIHVSILPNRSRIVNGKWVI